MHASDDSGVPLVVPRGTILVADDNLDIREVLRKALEHAGYQVFEAANGAEAAQIVIDRLPDLVVLDMVMPYVSGLELLQRWRKEHIDISVIVLTGFGDEESVGDALAAGADDHIAKPVRLRELVERVNAVLRRTQKWQLHNAQIVVGQVRLDLTKQHVTVGERAILLSKTEMALLRELMVAPGRVLAPEELLAKVWGPEYRGDAEILRTNIYRLRRKLDAGQFIQSRPGVGYFVTLDADPIT